MVTITAVTASGSSQFYKGYISGPADPSSDTVEMDVDPGLTHCFIGVQMFNSAGARISAATAGTFTVNVKTLNTEQFEVILTPTIDATAPDTVSAAGNIRQVRVVPDSVAGNDVTSWRVFVTCNRN